MIRILFVLPEFNFGGTVFSTLNIISLLDKRKYDVNVLAMTHQGPVKKKYLERGIKILPENLYLASLTGRWNKEVRLVRKSVFIINKLIRRAFNIIDVNYLDLVYEKTSTQFNSYDVVVACQEGRATEFTSFIPAKRKIAFFRSECKFWIHEVDSDIEIAKKKVLSYYEKFDNVVCVSETTRKDMEECLPELKDQLVAIHNVQNVDNILSDSTKPIDDPLFKTDKFTIVSIGRMNPQKRFADIPEICKRLKDAGCIFHWYILGGGNTYGEYDKLIDNMAKYETSDCLTCLGEKINPYPYIKQSNLLVNTSYIEACPRVVIEAKILHTPVVCADFDSAFEFITNGLDGYIEPLSKIHRPIISMINDDSVYSNIKKKCNEYEFSNAVLLNKLEKLLS